MSKAEVPPKDERARREEKRAQALRANLRRRKAGPAKTPSPGGGEKEPKKP
ncbi:MAG TPA: hypothetical protein VGC92_13215 [Phenylobacterium sp.]|jgi:hypothetical protein